MPRPEVVSPAPEAPSRLIGAPSAPAPEAPSRLIGAPSAPGPEAPSRLIGAPSAPAPEAPGHVIGAANAPEPPVSATREVVTLCGLVGFFAGLAAVGHWAFSPVGEILVMLGATGFPMLIADTVFLGAWRRPTTGLAWRRPPDFSLSRSAVKLLGLAGTLAALASGYWLFPEYQGSQYAIVYDFARVTGPDFALAAPLYIVVIDAYMADPKDGYWQAGSLLLGRRRDIEPAVLGQYCLSWLMKGFFVPFVISVFLANMNAVFTSDFARGASGLRPLYEYFFFLTYGVDTAFGALGYLVTTRLTDTQIRSTEPTVLGWLVALVCHPPFWPVIGEHFLPYSSHAVLWADWLGSVPVVYAVWGFLILCCLAVDAWSTAAFGCRFSNLTHRGILTNGPYRWCKHPAYLSKNLSYWLISVPFIATGGAGEAVAGCLMLALVNLIYFARARTEERRLSRDPVYVAYALWMNERGLLRWTGQLVPLLRYKVPTA
jgi:protein-S-isoprenylcysteine O-methyltransferase Ste14